MSNGSRNAERAVCAHPKTHLVPTFAAPAPANSIPEEGKYYRPALSGKVIGVSKVQFQILVPHPKNTLHAARILK
ncbi:hypothetical protein TNCV_1876741 [Trichonephila clavipes]|nr:hypothetical protein TNCV_1876741 [Trichonephila clavipes]